MNLLVVIGIAVGLAMDTFAVALGASASLGRVTGRQVFRFAFHFGLFQAVMPIIGWLAGRGLETYIHAWDHLVAFGLLAFIGSKAIVAALRGSLASQGDADGSAEREGNESRAGNVGRVAPGPPLFPDSDAPSGLRRAKGDPPYNRAPTPVLDDQGARPASRSDAKAPSEAHAWPGPGDVRRADPTRGWTLLVLSVATSIDALAVGLTLGVLAGGRSGGVGIWLAVLIIGLITAALTTLGMHLGSRLGSLLGRRFSRVTEIVGGLVLIGIGLKILLEHVAA